MLIKVIVATLLLFVVQHVLKLTYLMGFHLHLNKHYPGPCQAVKGLDYGAENFHVFPDGLAFITSGCTIDGESEARMEFIKKHNIVGKIYLFDFNKKVIIAEDLAIIADNEFKFAAFAPHGISGWEDKQSGKKYIFVVNHEIGGGEAVDKFLYLPAKKTLQHIKRYTDDTMTLMNDVQATGEDSFYFTNFATSYNRLWMFIKIICQIGKENVGYFDGNTYRIVVENLGMANGIAMSHDRRFIYININMFREIHVYERQRNNDLVQKQIYPLYTSPDNVVIDVKTDDLYVGGIPIMYKSLTHMTYPDNRAPTQILKLTVRDGNITDTTELFYDDGDLISMGTTGIIYNSKLLIGSFMDKLVYCDVKVPV